MAEGRAQREAIADAVHIGYAEARVAAGIWKGRVPRFWRPDSTRALTPEENEAVFDRIAGNFPGARVH